jgi:hypothetical protein
MIPVTFPALAWGQMVTVPPCGGLVADPQIQYTTAPFANVWPK